MATLQYSCLETSMDRGVWWATIYGIAKNWAWLSDSHFHFSEPHTQATLCPGLGIKIALLMLTVVFPAGKALSHTCPMDLVLMGEMLQGPNGFSASIISKTLIKEPWSHKSSRSGLRTRKTCAGAGVSITFTLFSFFCWWVGQGGHCPWTYSAFLNCSQKRVNHRHY